MSSVILLGSSRSDGNTARLAQCFAARIDGTVIDLSSYTILPFDYAFQNRDDDFLTLVEQLLNYDTLVFASLVYWYSPSATMKLFMDRLSDLLEIHKVLGRSLKHKKAALLATGSAHDAPECFESVFSSTFKYFDMDYLGMLYCQFGAAARQRPLERIADLDSLAWGRLSRLIK